MSKRRFSITEEQAYAVKAGLALLIDYAKKSKFQYDKWLLEVASDLFEKLSRYTWYK